MPGGFFYSHNRPSQTQVAIDPIVFPGEVGEGHHGPHLHDFGGRVGVTKDSRPQDLYDALSTGPEREGGTYWVPSLYINGVHVMPTDFSARYGLGTAGKENPSRLIPFPEGYGVVAGRTAKTVVWNVDKPVKPSVKSFDTIPVVEGRDTICSITFPDLWNGEEPDGPDWTRNTAYSVRGVCPDGWWVLPSLVLKMHYGKHLPKIETAELSSGPPNTMHADFFNTWSPERLRRLVDYCIRGLRNCGESGTGPQPPA